MSILDPDFAEEVNEYNVPISIEALHQEGWEFSQLNRTGVNDGEYEYPDMSSWPITGGSPWNPFWMVKKLDIHNEDHKPEIIRIKLIWARRWQGRNVEPLSEEVVFDGNNGEWSITRQPYKIMFEFQEESYYAHNIGELRKVEELKTYERLADRILTTFKTQKVK